MRKTSRWILNRFLFGLVSLPLAIAAVPGALTGGAESAARRQVRNTRRLTTAPHSSGTVIKGRARVIAHTVVAFVPALMMVYLVGAAFLYPLRPDTISTIGHPFTHDPALDGSWGGTALAGAWLAHAVIGVGLELLAVLVLWAASTVQLKVMRGLLR